MYDFVEDVAKLCIEKLIKDPISYTIRKESSKCLRFCIAACKDHPDKMKGLYIITYVALSEELQKRLQKREFDQVNSILKELHKQLALFEFFKDRGLFIYSLEDAVTFLKKLTEIAGLIREDKQRRKGEIKRLAAKVDEEDLEYLEEDLENVDKGLHHIMEIHGQLSKNMGA